MNCRGSHGHGFHGCRRRSLAALVQRAPWRPLEGRDGVNLYRGVSTIRQIIDGAAPCAHWTLICACVSVALKISVDGQTGQVTPSAPLFGSPLRMKAEIVLIIAADSA
jgi:hypothetical protein